MSVVPSDFAQPELARLHVDRRETYLPQIDALRGIAALSVVFFHLYRNIYPKSELEPLRMLSDLRANPGVWRWLAAPSLFGYAGVPLFFVISGFCIHHSFLRTQRFSFPPYIGRRFWRIYPAYVVAIAVALLLPGNLIWRAHHAPKSILMHLLFLHNLNHTTIYEISPPFWTLAVEFQFYLAYPLLLMLRRRIGIYTGAWFSFGLCAGLSIIAHQKWENDLKLLLMPAMYWVQWVLGAAIAERFSQGKLPLMNLPAAMLLCIVAILFAVPIATYGEWNYLAWAVLCAAIIERWIRRPARKRFSLLVWTGAISYSIYLLHVTLLQQLLPWLPGLPGMRFGLALISVFPVIIACSAASYYLIEMPCIAVGRRCVNWSFPSGRRIH